MKTPDPLFSSLAAEWVSCRKNHETAHESAVSERVFGKLPDGRVAKIFTLTNRNGLKACVTDYGAILVSMETPDKSGNFADITHGYDNLESWLANTSYFGATIGRFGNRIGRGKFTLEGRDYTLVTNNDPGGIPCHLHGGTMGFDKVLWTGRITDSMGVEFSHVSPDGDEGYPGALNVKVTYSLTDDNELKWEVTATTDAVTVVNLVHHTYWNLSGNPTQSICDHELKLAAPHYLPTDAGLIPTGEISPVADTPMDFTRPTVIGERIDADFEALRFGGGYDHCWVLESGEGVRFAARAKHPSSGRVMEVFTDQPAIQFYAGNFIDGSVPGKGGVSYAPRSAFCLETEGFPDAPNKPHFPSCVLRPGEIYQHVLIHKFSAE